MKIKVDYPSAATVLIVFVSMVPYLFISIARINVILFSLFIEIGSISEGL